MEMEKSKEQDSKQFETHDAASSTACDSTAGGGAGRRITVQCRQRVCLAFVAEGMLVGSEANHTSMHD